MFSPLRKTSVTLNGTLSSKTIDLDSMYYNFPMDKTISHIKYNNRMKTETDESVCSTLLNQLTIKLVNGVNIKLFCNSAFSISGAGNVDTAMAFATETLNKILKSLVKISIEMQIKPTNVEGFYCHYDNRIITRSGGALVPSFNTVGKKIIINGKQCVPFEIVAGTYIDVKHIDKKKNIYNNMCEIIGNVEYQMIRKNKSLCIKNCKYIKVPGFDNKYSIVNPYSNEIGFLIVYITGSIEPVFLAETISITASICEPTTCIFSIQFSNCNYNLRYGDDNTFIDRDKICNELTKLNVDYTYNPSSYPGVKFTVDGAKITIFRTGSILFSSKKSITTVALPFVYDLFKVDFTIQQMEPVSQDDAGETLSIWDI